MRFSLVAGPFGPLVGRSVVVTMAVVGGLSLSASLVRLLPWLLDERVPASLSWLFAKGLCLLAVEASCVIALPVGAAVAGAMASDRGEARACLLMGASPAWLSSRALAVMALPAALLFWASLSWGREAEAPARAMMTLIDVARASCDPVARPVVEIPGVGASVLCDGAGPPRLVYVQRGLVLRAERVTLSDDGRSLEAVGLWLSSKGAHEVHVEAEGARISPLSVLSQRGSTRATPRAFSLTFAALSGAFACLSAMLSRQETRRSVALLTGGASALVPLWLSGQLDRLGLAPQAHALVALSSLLAPLLFVGASGMTRAMARR